MVLDINLFRAAKGGNPDAVRESQRRRFASVELVDEIIALDEQWVKASYALAQLNKEANALTRQFAAARKAEDVEGCGALTAKIAATKEAIEAEKKREAELLAARDAKLNTVGNLVPDDVPVFRDEEHNAVVSLSKVDKESAASYPLLSPSLVLPGALDARAQPATSLLSHIRLFERLQASDTVRGVKVAGSRGYYLTRAGALLNHALLSYALKFLVARGFTPVQTPFFMEQACMARCAQLEDFDEQLYKVTGEGNPKYLIATSEQTLCCLHMGEVLDLKSPDCAHRLEYRSIGRERRGEPAAVARDAGCILYAGTSTCFRKEAGRHGSDTLGIFRIHQFEKVEQFVVCRAEDSWDLMEYMIDNCRAFYDSLRLPYRVVTIVSGELNNAAAKKYDLEAWFPASKCYRELVSCSNCLDYQSRSLDIKYQDGKDRPFAHLLNCTMTATERTMCCLLENYQTETGVIVPEVLRDYMGTDFLPFLC